MAERCVSCELQFVNGDKYFPCEDGDVICVKCVGDGPFIDINTAEECDEAPSPLVWGEQ